MPRFNFDPNAVSASIEVLPKDSYEFIIGEPKSFMRKNRKGEDSYGIRYPLVVAEGPHKDKRVFYSIYQQSEGAQAVGKQFLMAALGYDRSSDAEKEYNAAHGGADFSFNTDDQTVGDGWMELKGQRVNGELDVAMNDETGAEMQQFPAGCWSPIR